MRLRLLDVTLHAAESCAKSIGTLENQRQDINGYRKDLSVARFRPQL